VQWRPSRWPLQYNPDKCQSKCATRGPTEAESDAEDSRPARSRRGRLGGRWHTTAPIRRREGMSRLNASLCATRRFVEPRRPFLLLIGVPETGGRGTSEIRAREFVSARTNLSQIAARDYD
jgi:hypothetical protein